MDLTQISRDYGISPEILVILYIGSIVPIYGGLFLMLGSPKPFLNALRGVTAWQLVKIIPVIKPLAKVVRQELLTLKASRILGLILHLFGWALPYLYVVFFGHGLHIGLKLAAAVLLVSAIIWPIRLFTKTPAENV